MRTLYIITRILTFPGAYLRGFWEQLTCRILGLPVEIPGYLRIDEACSHVEHALAKKGFASYLMATGAGFMNFMTGLPTFLAGFMNLRYMGLTPYDNLGYFIFYVIITYVGFSMLCNIFPLVEDAMNLFDVAYKQKKMNIVGRIVLAIPSAITFAGAYLEKYCITFIALAAAIVLSFVI